MFLNRPHGLLHDANIVFGGVLVRSEDHVHIPVHVSSVRTLVRHQELLPRHLRPEHREDRLLYNGFYADHPITPKSCSVDEIVTV